MNLEYNDVNIFLVWPKAVASLAALCDLFLCMPKLSDKLFISLCWKSEPP